MVTDGFIIKLIRDALVMVLITAAPMLGLGLAVGLLVSLFQSATSIQETTLTFVPKIIALFVAIAIFGPWMLTTLREYIVGLIDLFPQIVR
ncbi:MAG: flagellar biosynthesis protein FliQ [bacterium]